MDYRQCDKKYYFQFYADVSYSSARVLLKRKQWSFPPIYGWGVARSVLTVHPTMTIGPFPSRASQVDTQAELRATSHWKAALPPAAGDVRCSPARFIQLMATTRFPYNFFIAHSFWVSQHLYIFKLRKRKLVSINFFIVQFPTSKFLPLEMLQHVCVVPHETLRAKNSHFLWSSSKR